ncbi:MAG: hypothetical protein FJ179_04010 [Gammaproteobacteria bacterium]|nr:hypothetical protein [Gammaproteobacteria bacterium]
MNEPMNPDNADPETLADHREARTEVIKVYGSVWSQAIAKSGVTDEKVSENLLQVCAACYLDGVHQGSRLTIDEIVATQKKPEHARQSA